MNTTRHTDFYTDTDKFTGCCCDRVAGLHTLNDLFTFTNKIYRQLTV